MLKSKYKRLKGFIRFKNMAAYKAIIPSAYSIYCEKFSIKQGHISFEVREILKDESNIIVQNAYFKFDKFKPDNDTVAYMLATFFGQTYKTIVIDLVVSDICAKNILTFTKAQTLIFRKITSHKVKKDNIIQNKALLSFSGGFDSLAAYYLMPKNTSLVSIDFGGWFERETEFFSQFETYIVETNIRRLIKIDKNSWTFMGLAAILYKKYLNTDTIVFGTILESSFSLLNSFEKPVTAPMPFNFINFKSQRYVQGLTEVGTAMVAAKYAPPEILKGSLESLAAKGSVKLFRKELLLTIAYKRFGMGININEFNLPKRPFQYGEYHVDDFLIFYTIKHLGVDTALKIIRDIPDEVIDLSQRLTLNFYERVCSEMIYVADEQNYHSLLEQAHIEKWDEKDWEEIIQVLNILREVHPKIPLIKLPEKYLK